MNTNNFNLTVTGSRSAGFSSTTRSITYLLLTLLLSFSTLTQADGLFDFQMKLAQKGNAEAQYKVGEMYETGFGVKEDKVEARNWITKASDQGHETAGFKLLYWDIEKNGITDANKAGLDSLRAKAKEGNPQAEYYVGKMYSRGVGVSRDSGKAIKWLNKAAFVGVLEAEREVTMVRENQQRWAMEKKRKEEKKRAEKRAQKERERLAKQEKQRKQQAKLQAKKDAEAKSRAAELEKQNKAAADARAKANKEAAEKARKQQMLAQQEADSKRREAEKQALIKKREAEEKKRKAQFESDPCSGKSARFLSTCK